jgi:hypothetical protein
MDGCGRWLDNAFIERLWADAVQRVVKALLSNF